MEPREVKEVEQIFHLKTRREKRGKRGKRRHRKYILLEVLKCIFLMIVAMISAAIIIPKSEAAPEKALLIYEFCAIILIIILVSFWMNKPRGKK